MIDKELPDAASVDFAGSHGLDLANTLKVNADVQKVYDKVLRSCVYELGTNGAQATMRFSKDEKGMEGIGLVLPFLVLQVFLPQGAERPFSVEMTVTDVSHIRRHILLDVHVDEVQTRGGSARLPIARVHRDAWLNLCLDWDSLSRLSFGQAAKSVDNVIVHCECRLRKVFALRSLSFGLVSATLEADDDTSLPAVRMTEPCSHEDVNAGAFSGTISFETLQLPDGLTRLPGADAGRSRLVDVSNPSEPYCRAESNEGETRGWMPRLPGSNISYEDMVRRPSQAGQDPPGEGVAGCEPFPGGAAAGHAPAGIHGCLGGAQGLEASGLSKGRRHCQTGTCAGAPKARLEQPFPGGGCAASLQRLLPAPVPHGPKAIGSTCATSGRAARDGPAKRPKSRKRADERLPAQCGQLSAGCCEDTGDSADTPSSLPIPPRCVEVGSSVAGVCSSDSRLGRRPLASREAKARASPSFPRQVPPARGRRARPRPLDLCSARDARANDDLSSGSRSAPAVVYQQPCSGGSGHGNARHCPRRVGLRTSLGKSCEEESMSSSPNAARRRRRDLAMKTLYKTAEIYGVHGPQRLAALPRTDRGDEVPKSASGGQGADEDDEEALRLDQAPQGGAPEGAGADSAGRPSSNRSSSPSTCFPGLAFAMALAGSEEGPEVHREGGAAWGAFGTTFRHCDRFRRPEPFSGLGEQFFQLALAPRAPYVPVSASDDNDIIKDSLRRASLSRVARLGQVAEVEDHGGCSDTSCCTSLCSDKDGSVAAGQCGLVSEVEECFVVAPGKTESGDEAVMRLPSSRSCSTQSSSRNKSSSPRRRFRRSRVLHCDHRQVQEQCLSAPDVEPFRHTNEPSAPTQRQARVVEEEPGDVSDGDPAGMFAAFEEAHLGAPSASPLAARLSRLPAGGRDSVGTNLLCTFATGRPFTPPVVPVGKLLRTCCH